MSLETAPREQSAWKRKPLAEMPDATLGDFFRHPNSLIAPADIASAVPGYSTHKSIKTAVDKGHLRPPTRLPNGRHAWRAGDVVRDFGLEELRPAEDRRAPAANGGGAR